MNMKLRYILGIFLIALAVVALLTNSSYAQLGGGSGTINQLTQWITSDGYVKTASTTVKLWVPGLASSDECIKTDATGKTYTGACGTGGSGDNYLTNSGSNTYLNTGTNLQAPSFQATSTTATSTFTNLAASGYAWLTNLYTTATAYIAGTLRVGGNTTLDGNLSVAGTTSLGTTTTSNLNGVIYVDGVHYAKTGAGIQAAINQACLNGGGGVELTVGTYLVNSQIDLCSNVTLSGFGTSTTLRPQSNIITLFISGAQNVTVKNIAIDGADSTTNTDASGIRLRNSTNVHIENNIISNQTAFGVFIDAGGTGTTSQVWIENNYIEGEGTNDVIGGGPNNSTTKVSDVFVLNNYVIQDCTVGTYCAAFDVVAETNFTIQGNHFYGKVQPGFENFPHTNLNISNNQIIPAIGENETYLYISTTDNATKNSSFINISNNNIASGTIQAFGTSTSYIENINITGNIVDVADLADGITLRYATNGSIVGNTIIRGESGIQFATSSSFIVSGNTIKDANFGVNIDASSTLISMGINNYDNILNQDVLGSAQVNIIRSSPNQTGDLAFTDTRQTDPAGNYYFSNYADALGIYRGVSGISGNVKLQIDNSQVTMGNWGVKNKTLGLFSGSNLVYFPISGSSYINNGYNFGIGTTSPYAVLSVNIPATSTTTTAFAIASSTSNSTSTLFSIDNTGSTTASNGFNIASGCYSVNGVCLANNPLSGTGSNNMLTAWSSATGLSATGTPSAASYIATSTTATSTFAGGLSVGTVAPTSIVQLVTGTGNMTSGSSFRTGRTLSQYIQISGDASGNYIVGDNTINKTMYFGTAGPSDFVFRASSTDVARFAQATGNFGIASSSPWGKLSVLNVGTGASFVVEDESPDSSPFIIDASGNVGIGTTSPYSKLSVAGQVVAQNYVATDTTSISSFAGKVGVGTTTPSDDFAVAGGGFFSDILTALGVLYARAGAIVSTFLQIPNDTNPTVDAVGEIAVDTTANQFLYGTSTAFPAVVMPFNYIRFEVASSSWTSTSTANWGGYVQDPLTLVSANCYTDAGTVKLSIADDKGNYTNVVSVSTSTTTPATLSTNNTFTAGEKLIFNVGTPASSPTKASCTIKYVYDRQ